MFGIANWCGKQINVNDIDGFVIACMTIVRENGKMILEMKLTEKIIHQ